MPSSLMFAIALNARDVHAGDDPCKRAKLEEDKFGGGTKVVYVVHTAGAVGMDLMVTGGTTELHAFVREMGHIDGIIAAGTTVPFSFDGTVLTLTTARDGARASAVDPVSNLTVTATPFTFVLTRDQLQTMSRTNLAAIRFPVQSGTFDWTPSKGIQEKVQEASACALKYAK